MSTNSLTAEREHLANLLEAVQRCAHFLHASSSKVGWPQDGSGLKQRQKDEALFEKLGVIESIDNWQMCRTARNLAAHDYETDYALIAEHFNELQTLQPVLVGTASRLLALCRQSLGVSPTTADFEAEFLRVCATIHTGI